MFSLGRATTIAVLLGVLLGCGPSAERRTSEAAESEDTSDLQVTEAVTARLRSDHTVWSDNIAVSTNRGMVRLTGVVRSELARQQAARIVAQTEGVAGVDNQLQVTN